MKRINTFVISLIVVIMASLAASCGGANIGLGNPENNEPATPAEGNADLLIDKNVNPEEFPGFPVDDESDGEAIVLEAKGASWVASPNHLTPWASHLGMIDPVDPACYLLEGRKPVFTHVPTGSGIAYAIYKVPLGALEADLLSMKIEAHPGAAGDVYFGGIANFTAMHWQFSGPHGAMPTWGTDMTSLGYDFTNAAGDMYVALIVPQAQSLHVKDIILEFKDQDKPNDDKPTWWNVWGQAYEDYATGAPHAAYQVSFEDVNSGVIYTTTTASNGHWGMNLPTGQYLFGIDSNEMLLDVSGPVDMIEYIYGMSGFGIRLDLGNTGEFTYEGGNAAYAGAVVPMPLITSNSF